MTRSIPSGLQNANKKRLACMRNGLSQSWKCVLFLGPATALRFSGRYCRPASLFGPPLLEMTNSVPVRNGTDSVFSPLYPELGGVHILAAHRGFDGAAYGFHIKTRSDRNPVESDECPSGRRGVPQTPAPPCPFHSSRSGCGGRLLARARESAIHCRRRRCLDFGAVH